MKETILVIDDEVEMLENCRRLLSKAGYRPVVTSDASKLSALMETERPSLILTDLRMPGTDGMQVLAQAKGSGAGIPVILFTAFATVETAVNAMRQGAFDYVPKPFTNEHLLLVIEKALKQKRLVEENYQLKQKLGTLYGLDKIIGTSPKLRDVLETVRKVAPTEANILVQGESGTGKELIARILHMNSKRRDGPFVPVDCASLPEQLLESELFGHEKGAFTDAYAAKPGIFEHADGGTLFLDEIGDMPAGLQAKLLRALQERQVRRLGSNRIVNFDVRVVSATNKNLAEEVQAKRFRLELYYRLNVVTVELPPLREREGDAGLLAKHFLDHFLSSSPRKISGMTEEALRLLERYSWPGNVRELQNAIERAVALAEADKIGPGDFPPAIRTQGLSNGAALTGKRSKGYSRKKKNEYA